MALFRRKRRDEAEPGAAAPDTPSAEATPVAETAAATGSASGSEATHASQEASGDAGGEEIGADRLGPFDSGALPGRDGYVDLGAIWIPAIEGIMLTMEVDEASGDVTAVRVHVRDSLLQLQAFAAPRSRGVWQEIREEIAAGLPQQGGSCEHTEGPYGPELLARVPSAGPDGPATTVAMRFLGIDGPRWFLRGVVSGPAATDPELARPFVDLLRVVVVHRGQDPRAPRELLPLQLPSEPAAPVAVPDANERSAEDLRPFERGPEITEIR